MNTDFKAITKKKDLKLKFVEQLAATLKVTSDEAERIFKKEASFAIQIAQNNPSLRECSPESVMKSIINLAQVGLTLNPVLKRAYLVPRYNRTTKGKDCCLEPGYQGLMYLLNDAGIVHSMNVQIVWQGDEIEIDKATERQITKHVPYIVTGKDQGKVRAVYSQATLKDGSLHTEIMSVKDIEEIRERSESYKAFKAKKLDGKFVIWETDFPEMCRKTIIKRHEKYLPKSDGSERLAKAIEFDNYANGFDQPVSWQSIQYIESLLSKSSLDQTKRDSINREVTRIEHQSEANKIINYLEENQLDPVTHGGAFQAGDIQENLNKLS